MLFRVCVMDKGRIVEIGQPKDLMDDKNSEFFKLAKSAGVIK